MNTGDGTGTNNRLLFDGTFNDPCDAAGNRARKTETSPATTSPAPVITTTG
jgi:hypothetical protein